MLGALIGVLQATPKAISVAPTAVFGGAYGPGTATSDPITVTTSNLVAPVNYLWTRVSGSTNIYASDLSAKTITFYGYVNGANISAVWKCTVTDAAGFSQDTDPVTVNFEDYFV